MHNQLLHDRSLLSYLLSGIAKQIKLKGEKNPKTAHKNSKHRHANRADVVQCRSNNQEDLKVIADIMACTSN